MPIHHILSRIGAHAYDEGQTKSASRRQHHACAAEVAWLLAGVQGVVDLLIEQQKTALPETVPEFNRGVS
jgi:hypothetical protein